MSNISREAGREIREAIYQLERDHGAEAVVEQFKHVVRYDDAFDGVEL